MMVNINPADISSFYGSSLATLNVVNRSKAAMECILENFGDDEFTKKEYESFADTESQSSLDTLRKYGFVHIVRVEEFPIEVPVAPDKVFSNDDGSITFSQLDFWRLHGEVDILERVFNNGNPFTLREVSCEPKTITGKRYFYKANYPGFWEAIGVSARYIDNDIVSEMISKLNNRAEKLKELYAIAQLFESRD